MFRSSTISIAITFLLPLLIDLAAASPPLHRACDAPPLPSPSGTVVTVSTESALQAAVNSITSGTTILVQPGTYNLTSTPQGTVPDIGADEFSLGSQPPEAPTNVRVLP